MGEKYKNYFELINDSLWLLLKNYVSDEKAYKDIMKELFITFMMKDQAKDKYSDSWWDSLIVLYDIPEKYKGKNVCGFGAELADGFYEFLKKTENGSELNEDETFYKCVSVAFITEWRRLKNEETSKTHNSGRKESSGKQKT